MIVHVYHVHIVCGYGMLTSSNESETIANRDKKNTDCEKRIVIVNLSHCYSSILCFYVCQWHNVVELKSCNNVWWDVVSLCS